MGTGPRRLAPLTNRIKLTKYRFGDAGRSRTSTTKPRKGAVVGPQRPWAQPHSALLGKGQSMDGSGGLGGFWNNPP